MFRVRCRLLCLSRDLTTRSAPGPVMLTSLTLSYRLHVESHCSLVSQIKASDLHCSAVDFVVRLNLERKAKNHFLRFLFSLKLNEYEC